MNSKQAIGSILLFIILLLIFPAIVSFIITACWVGWVLIANSDGLSKEDGKYDRDEAILSTKNDVVSQSTDEKVSVPKKTYSALEERKALLRDEIR